MSKQAIIDTNEPILLALHGMAFDCPELDDMFYSFVRRICLLATGRGLSVVYESPAIQQDRGEYMRLDFNVDTYLIVYRYDTEHANGEYAGACSIHECSACHHSNILGPNMEPIASHRENNQGKIFACMTCLYETGNEYHFINFDHIVSRANEMDLYIAPIEQAIS